MYQGAVSREATANKLFYVPERVATMGRTLLCIKIFQRWEHFGEDFIQIKKKNLKFWRRVFYSVEPNYNDANPFRDKLAYTVRYYFFSLLDSGFSVGRTNEIVIESFKASIVDRKDYSVMYIALAILQVEESYVDNELKEKVFEIINNNEFPDIWLNEPELLEKRKNLLFII